MIGDGTLDGKRTGSHELGILGSSRQQQECWHQVSLRQHYNSLWHLQGSHWCRLHRTQRLRWHFHHPTQNSSRRPNVKFLIGHWPSLSFSYCKIISALIINACFETIYEVVGARVSYPVSGSIVPIVDSLRPGSTPIKSSTVTPSLSSLSMFQDSHIVVSSNLMWPIRLSYCYTHFMKELDDGMRTHLSIQELMYNLSWVPHFPLTSPLALSPLPVKGSHFQVFWYYNPPLLDRLDSHCWRCPCSVFQGLRTMVEAFCEFKP